MIPWNKGLTKYTDKRLLTAGRTSSKNKKLLFKKGKLKIWNKGLLASTDERVKRNSEHQRLSHLGTKLSKEECERHRQRAIKKWKDLDYRSKQITTRSSKEFRNKISKILSTASRWYIHGNSLHMYSMEWTKEKRQKIRRRDKFTCQIPECSKHGLSVHHIDYNKQNCDDFNLITLCKSCHSKTGFNREYWIEYFNDIMEEKRNEFNS